MTVPAALVVDATSHHRTWRRAIAARGSAGAIGGGARRSGLRRRILLIFTLGSLMLSLFLAVRHLQLHPLERGPAARPNAAIDARRSRHASVACRRCSAATPPTPQAAIERLSTAFGVAASAHLVQRTQWTPGRRRYDQTEHPAGTRRRGSSTTACRPRMRVHVGDELNIVVGRAAPGSTTPPTSSSSASTRSTDTLGERPALAAVRRDHHHAARRAARRRSPRVAPCDPSASPPRRPRRSPAGGSTPGSNRPTTPTCSVLANSFNDMASALQTAHRARRPVRVRRQPRAALAADDACRRRSR